MKNKFLMIAMLLMASAALISCGDTTGGNTAGTENTAPANTAPAPESAADVEAELKKNMDGTAAALLKNDVAAMDSAWTEDYMVVMPDGKQYTKAERLEVFKSGEVKYEKFDVKDMKVRSYGDTAVSISTVEVKGTNKGTPFDGKWILTAVHRKTPDGWKSASSQLTAIAPDTADAPAKPDDSPAKPDAANKPDDSGDTY